MAASIRFKILKHDFYSSIRKHSDILFTLTVDRGHRERMEGGMALHEESLQVDSASKNFPWK